MKVAWCMMVFRELYDPKKGSMQVAAFMSGTGSNLAMLLDTERFLRLQGKKPSYHISLIFTDNPKSNAQAIADKYNSGYIGEPIPVITSDIREFYRYRGEKLSNMQVRVEYDAKTLELLVSYSIDLIAFAGYMPIATSTLIRNHLIVNVHPADLTILDDQGHRKYVGKGHDVVKMALLDGQRYLKSTTHIVDEKVDHGALLMLSRPVKVYYPDDWEKRKDDDVYVDRIADANQKVLKEEGDLVIFPQTITDISQGRYSIDEYGHAYYDGRAIAQGRQIGGRE